MSTQRRSWHTRYLPQSPARSHASSRNSAKVHHANVSTSAKTWVLCVQEWFLSSRDRLKKSRVLARATCECSSRAQRASHSPTARVLCTMHSATLQPALIKRSPSMVSQHAAGGGMAAVAVVPPLSAPCSSSRAHCCRASKRARCRSRHTLAATQVLAKLCGALSAALSLHTLHSCCTFDASFLHPLQVLTLQSAVSSCPRDVL